MFYPLLCASFAIKSYDYGKDVRFLHKTKCQAADKIVERGFLKKFKATCKDLVNLS